jgi:hypothetical protein
MCILNTYNLAAPQLLILLALLLLTTYHKCSLTNEYRLLLHICLNVCFLKH